MRSMMFLMIFALALPAFGQEKVTAPTPKKVVATAITSVGPELGFKAEEMFVGKLGVESAKFVMIRKSLMASFEKMYDGEEVVIGQVVRTTRADKLLVGKLTYKFRPASLVSNIVCQTSFSYKVLSEGGDVLNQGVIIQNSAGLSEATALEANLTRLAREFRP